MKIEAEMFRITPVSDPDLPAVLEIYRQCEDFLALGPVAQASTGMVQADMQHSRETSGRFCGIYAKPGGQMLGILDFIAGDDPREAPYISLLMIAGPHRGQGLGAAVVAALEAYLLRRTPFEVIEASVQVNNPAALRFWQRQGFQVISGPELQDDGTTSVRLRKKF